jgi:stearoyl-CoA desaturase (delta-9 desaturase)
LHTEITELPDYRRVNWSTAAVLVVFHAGALAAPFFFTWSAFWTAIALNWIALSWGIGLGYHRLHTHRSYQAPRWLEYFFAMCGTLSLEGGPIFWVATHRIHHQRSDQPGDPHSPRDGAWWAHVGWILIGKAQHNATQTMARYAPDLAKDRFYVWLNNYHYLPLVVVGLTLWAIGGLPMLFWAVFLRVSLGLHFTWLVNSATHLWGSRRFNTRDDSRNSWWVALLTFGEGWHNNHHAHPTSARHGLAWYEVDLTWLQLRLLKLVGLVHNVKTAKLNTPEPQRQAA